MKRKIDLSHIKSGPKVPKKTYDQIADMYPIDNLTKLINIAMYYEGTELNYKMLRSLVQPLIKLDKMVGMNNIKKDVINLILYYSQSLNYNKYDLKEEELLNSIIVGPPGTGKTTVANILAEIYCCMGFLTTSRVTVAKRTDFVGKYVGHSEARTKKLLEEAKGGVLLIDECYSLGDPEGKCTFAKAALDTLNQFLTENKDLICIIAGYEEQLESSFFNMNRGLKRRFPWKFTVDDYTNQDLVNIIKLKINESGWKYDFEDKEILNLFNNNKDYINFAGGDMETLLLKIKICHANRMFGKDIKNRRNLTLEDINEGFKMFKNHKPKFEDKVPEFMYT